MGLSKAIIIIGALILSVLVAVVLFRTVPRQNISLPTGGEITGTREIMITNSVKHSIPLNEIISGGPKTVFPQLIVRNLFLLLKHPSFFPIMSQGSR